MSAPNSIEKTDAVRLSLVKYPVPGSRAEIQILGEGSMTRYQIIEPSLLFDTQSSLQFLKGVVREKLKDPIIYRRFLKNFKSEITTIAQNQFPDLEKESISNLAYYIIRDTRGLGPIQPLLDDPYITQISITGPDQIITAQHQDYGVVFTSLGLSSADIRVLSKKLYNRAIQPVKSSTVPFEITLKSGHIVKFS